MTSITEITDGASELETVQAEIAALRHGRVPRELRRRQLLALAETLFEERGYAGASMDELAARAGVTKPVIYAQFDSKEGLFVSCVERLGVELAETVVEAVAGAEGPEDLLRRGSLATFRFVARRRPAWRMTFGSLSVVGDHPSESIAAKIEEIRERQHGLVGVVILEAAKELGAEPDPLEVDGVAHGLNGLYEGLLHWWQDHPEVTAETLADWVVGLVLPGLERLATAPGGAAPA